MTRGRQSFLRAWGGATAGVALPIPVAVVCYAAISRIYARAAVEVPLWTWFLPWHFQWTNDVLLAIALLGLGWSIRRRSHLWTVAVVAAVVVFGYLHMILVITHVPPPGAWFDLRLSALAETTCAVFDVAVVSALLNLALLAKGIRESGVAK